MFKNGYNTVMTYSITDKENKAKLIENRESKIDCVRIRD